MDKLRNPKKANDATERLQKSATMHKRNRSGAEEAFDTPATAQPTDQVMEPSPPAEKTVAQLVQEAQDTHKDTTRTAQRALNVVEQTKQVKNAMLVSLHDQNKRLENVDTELSTMNEHISYSQRILLYMGRCCGCITWICDCCTGADPEAQKKREWERKAKLESQREVHFDAAAVEKQAAAYNGTEASSSSPKKLTPSSTFNHRGGGEEEGTSQKPKLRTIQSDRYQTSSPESEGATTRFDFREIDVSMPKGYEVAGMNLAEESRKQNEIIDQIGDGIQELLSGAKVINEELARQDKHIDRLDNKADGTKSRLKNMNANSMLNKYKS
jgi:hypothetical protein